MRAKLLDWLPNDLTGCRVLDAGCGSGVFSEIAARTARSVLGFDASAEMIAIANARKARANLSNTTFAVAPLGDKTVLGGRAFDIILCSSVLEYVDDYWASFDWLAAALKPGDTVLVKGSLGSRMAVIVEALKGAAV